MMIRVEKMLKPGRSRFERRLEMDASFFIMRFVSAWTEKSSAQKTIGLYKSKDGTGDATHAAKRIR
jgi:hypothetical protein